MLIGKLLEVSFAFFWVSEDKIVAKSKFKTKWKMIQWLMTNKRDSINQLLRSPSHLYGKFGKGEGKNYRLGRGEFENFLSYAGLGGNQALIDK